MLESVGCTFKAENGTLKVCKGFLIVMKAKRHNGLYVLLGEVIIGDVNATNVRK